MSNQKSSYKSWRRKSKKKSAPLNRQLDLLGGVYGLGLKYQPTEGPICRIVNQKTYKYQNIKTVHLTLPLNEDSIDTRKAYLEAQRMVGNGRDGILIIRKTSKTIDISG